MIVSFKFITFITIIFFSSYTIRYSLPKATQDQKIIDEGFSIETPGTFRPYFGIWFGASAVFPGTDLADRINTALGGGVFIRGYLEKYHVAADISASYLYYTSRYIERLHSVPIYASFIGILPIPGPLRYLIKVGGGVNWFLNRPESHQNIIPLFVFGVEFYFPAGSFFNIGAKFEYLLAIESGLSVPVTLVNYQKINGHFFTFGLTLHITWL